ncbi:MAG: hypothetical protein ABIK68_11965 [bacterium]
MPLINFGSIMNFAEELETRDEQFYTAALKNPGATSHKAVFEQILSDCKKNKINIQRARRENVTEMILENIADFTRAAFVLEVGDPAGMSSQELLETAKKLEERAERYYLEAAVKIKALSEVARILKLVAKKRTAHRTALAG